MFGWDAKQYSKFKKERTLPAMDLANAINHENVKSVLDIGCGIGNSTAVLKKKFPSAKVIGADNSDDMLKSARENNPEIEFIKLDAEKELSDIKEKFDVVFSNACIQWIPNHHALLKNMFALLNDGGVMAVQIPQQSKHPVHKIICKTVQSEKWCDKFSYRRSYNNLSEEEYFDLLSEFSDNFRLWEISYFFLMPSHESIVEWYKGTGLRPYLEELNEADTAEFLSDFIIELKKIYPVQPGGNIIFKFPRLFFTVTK